MIGIGYIFFEWSNTARKWWHNNKGQQVLILKGLSHQEKQDPEFPSPPVLLLVGVFLFTAIPSIAVLSFAVDKHKFSVNIFFYFIFRSFASFLDTQWIYLKSLIVWNFLQKFFICEWCWWFNLTTSMLWIHFLVSPFAHNPLYENLK